MTLDDLKPIINEELVKALEDILAIRGELYVALVAKGFNRGLLAIAYESIQSAIALMRGEQSKHSKAYTCLILKIQAERYRLHNSDKAELLEQVILEINKISN